MRFSEVAHTGLFRRQRRREWLTAALDRLRGARIAEIAAIVCRELRFGVGAATAAIVRREDLPPDSALRRCSEAPPRPSCCSRPRALRAAAKVDRAWIEARDVALAAPIRARGGALAAVALVGPPREAEPTTAPTAGSSRRCSPARPPRGSSRNTGGARTRRWNARDAACVEPAPATCACGRDEPASLPRCLAGKFELVRRSAPAAWVCVSRARHALGRDVALKTLPAPRVARSRASATRRVRWPRSITSPGHDLRPRGLAPHAGARRRILRRRDAGRRLAHITAHGEIPPGNTPRGGVDLHARTRAAAPRREAQQHRPHGGRSNEAARLRAVGR